MVEWVDGLGESCGAVVLDVLVFEVVGEGVEDGAQASVGGVEGFLGSGADASLVLVGLVECGDGLSGGLFKVSYNHVVVKVAHEVEVVGGDDVMEFFFVLDSHFFGAVGVSGIVVMVADFRGEVVV